MQTGFLPGTGVRSGVLRRCSSTELRLSATSVDTTAINGAIFERDEQARQRRLLVNPHPDRHSLVRARRLPRLW